jgi:hypothetical protein
VNTLSVRILVISLMAIGMARNGWGQTARITGGAGLSAGTGSAAPAFDISAGYVTANRIGFEVALGVVPDLDFGTRRVSDTLPLPSPLSEFRTSVGAGGRLTLFQISAIGSLISKRQLHVSGVAGGGTASLRTTSHVHIDGITIPGFPELGLRDIVVPPVDHTASATSTGLALSAGMIADYDVARHVSVGADVRYCHTTTARALNLVRTIARIGWHF